MIEPAETVLADIETTAIEYDPNGNMLCPRKVHLLVANDYERDITHVFGPDPESIREGVAFLHASKYVIFHNGIRFDEFVLGELFGLEEKHPMHLLDSFVLTQLFYSNIKEGEDYARKAKNEKRAASDPLKFMGNHVGSHSLEAWGLRLDPPFKKGDYSDRMKILGIDPWEEWSPEMQEYAILDVKILRELWEQRLRDKFNNPANTPAIMIEHFMARLMNKTKISGIRIDKDRAEALCADLENRAVEIEALIEADFPARYEPVKWVHNPVELGEPVLHLLPIDEYEELQSIAGSDDIKDASRAYEIIKDLPKQHMTRLMYEHKENPLYRPRFNLPKGYHREQWGEVFTPKVTRKVIDPKTKEYLYTAHAGCPFVKIQKVALNPRSRPQIIRRLLEIGWIPEEFTDSGNPETSEATLHKIEEDFPIATNIAKYLLIQKRLGQIKTGNKAWLKLMGADGYIHPTIHACATVAMRAAHSDPNISQVPSVKMKDCVDSDGNKLLDEKGKVIQEPKVGEDGKWGWDCRACFVPHEGHIMVGSDLAGIEMRAWAHYLWPYDHGEFADVVLNRDVHEENRVILGFSDRRKAKEWLYACVPMNTEAMTRSGWKTHDSLVVGEEILTYNATTKVKEWKPLLELVQYDDADIVELFYSNGFRVQCTPNHRWFTRRRDVTKPGRFVDEVTTAEDMTVEHRIIQDAPMVGTPHWGFVLTANRLKRRYLRKDKVWCPRTENGSWVMRQGKTITITGNTMYGAGDEKLGFIIDPTADTDDQIELGAQSRARFMRGLKGYDSLNRRLVSDVKRGYVIGLDGRRIPVRKAHAALNTLLQAAGAVISKYWILYTMQKLDEAGLIWGRDADYTLLLYSHDELQFSCKPEHAELIKTAVRDAALKAGQKLGFKLPVEVGVVSGHHWGDTH